ncbi:phytanoyl-CoA dioxygenase family protein [Sphingosinicella sp. CPCC 101087]|uniref:phytanoyl-CoA dioxygenase family protein n=1 Tax=Sphingosinicella sp. CPCC 101087 TaxID=2497754 RepID=UPI00101CB03D|nr:phytanoyl-CoA dioxygenase family protein [Sphingosinicella sp. CPCC 101087]
MPAIDDLQLSIRSWAERLHGDGYCVIPDLVPPETIRALDDDLAPDFAATPFCRGRFYGERTKRFGRLLARSRHAAALVQNELVLGVAERLLSPWCDAIQLNLTQAIAVHPGALAQMPHRDQDMWRGETGEKEYLVNVMWPFTRYTRENGATRLWPESHGFRAHYPVAEASEQVPEVEPGSALLFLGSTLHAAGANASGEVRRGMIVGYSLGWLKSYENQFLAYPPAIARTFSPELAALIGYRQHRPNLGNFEGCCPSILLQDATPQHPGAVDALRPDQVLAVDEHAQLQLAPQSA